MFFLEDFLERAKNGVKEEVDLNESDNEPYSIVYGGILIADRIKKSEAFKSINAMKRYALANIEEGKISIAGYEDIIFWDKGTDNYIPFAALMKTTMRINDRECAVTYFPYMSEAIWTDIVYRHFLLAAKKAVEFTGTKENWLNQVNIEDWLTAYKSALFVTDEDDKKDCELLDILDGDELDILSGMEECISKHLNRNTRL